MLTAKNPLEKILNLGTGEGDYDPMIAAQTEQLISCDINQADVEFARALNVHVPNLHYRTENALDLSFDEEQFDLIVSVDVMEHVGNPKKMLEEMDRVLKPGGYALLTFPQTRFPFTYDPINRIAALFGVTRLIGQGAYAFGHEYLIEMDEMYEWLKESNLELKEEVGLSGYLIGGLEMYWTGIIQSLFKSNAKNVNDKETKSKKHLRPSLREPFLARLTDMIIWIDRQLFLGRRFSVGRGLILKKKQ